MPVLLVDGRWEAFEESRDELTSWLSEQEASLRREPQPQATLLDFEQLHAACQAQRQTIVARQAAVDDVARSGRELFETNCDSKVSHTITLLTARYHNLDSSSKVCTKRHNLDSSSKVRTVNKGNESNDAALTVID